MEFTGHNILLGNGQRTMGDKTMLLGESALWSSIRKALSFLFPGTIEERNRLRVADLGCLEGGYTVEFARMGFDTLGIEAREDNLVKCKYVKANLNLPNLKFVRDDARNIATYGKFDIVLCYGLLYHLDDPADFLKKVSGCTNKVLLLNTHFAPELDPRYSLGFVNNFILAPLQKRTGLFEFTKNQRLSSLQVNEGYRGRWKKEWNRRSSQSSIEKSLWASYNNHRSFWLCKKDLTKALHAAKFDSVFEQFDFTGDLLPDNFTHFYQRSMFVALKH